MALSAPDLVGPISMLYQPTSGPGSHRRSRSRPYRHARVEIDLTGEAKPAEGAPFLKRIEAFLSAKDHMESADLLRLTAAALHALSSRRFRWIDHWEVHPGGWLPPPQRAAGHVVSEPVGEFLTALEGPVAARAARARSFSIRLSDRRGNHVDIAIRRIHRQRRHALSLDFWGLWTTVMINDVTGSLSSRLPFSRATLTKFQYA